MTGYLLLICGDERHTDYAHQLGALLGRNGLPNWIDDPTGHGERPDPIQAQLDACTAVVVLMTPVSEASERVAWVLAHATARGRPIVPVLLAGGPFARLSHLPLIDVRGSRQPGPELVDWLRRWALAAAAVPDSPTAPPAPASSNRTRWPRWLPAVLVGVSTVWVLLCVLAVVVVRPWAIPAPDESRGSEVAGRPSTGPAVTCVTGRLTGQGSAAQVDAMNAWIAAYHASCPGAAISYQGTGSGAGLQAFAATTTDFAGTDSPLTDADQATANARCDRGRAIHLPMLVSPIAIVFHLVGVTRLTLSPATIASIFSGRVTSWSDPTIAAENPGVGLENIPIVAIHRGDASWTTDTFTSFLTAAAPASWAFGHDATWRAPGGSAAQGSTPISAMAKGVAGTIGYLPWSIAQDSSLPVAQIRTSTGAAVPLSAQTAGAAVRDATVSNQSDLKLVVDRTARSANAYPIVAVGYDIVCARGNPPDTVARLKAFLGFVAGPGQGTLPSPGYPPLPSQLQTRVLSVVNTLS